MIKNTKEYLNKIVHIEMDRPLGSFHPRYGFRYEINYGFVPNTVSGDGEEIDAYVMGVNEPLEEFDGKCVAIICRSEEDDDKLVVIPEELGDISDEEIIKATYFQEKRYHITINR
ncbi:Inorganic pyrophosphatase [Methanosarcina siciliae T4/M]|uniref:inorganic diphosphatase n=1 Tax=Methanosarcina siciliae T4/M TaxID=1434120 RepID=A0A0E3P6R7_9EURY|nr:inorganic diphosphatase [Methanosarcina siciliae]AKB29448.1 Inorganic pyrophosphatase [Methanosarcina siciliae T4/M]